MSTFDVRFRSSETIPRSLARRLVKVPTVVSERESNDQTRFMMYEAKYNVSSLKLITAVSFEVL